jgi:hypothetical protein
MVSNINKRIQDRSDALNNIQLTINPYILNQDVNTFKINTGLLGQSEQSKSDILNTADNYYQTRLGFSRSIFSNIIPNTLVEGFNANPISNIILDPYIETAFFGNYTPIKGQYLAFNNLNMKLTYDTSVSNDNKPILLTIIDNNTNGQIIYTVSNIDYYQTLKNAVVIDILSQTINTVSTTDNSKLQQLLTILGITVPNRLVMTIEQDTSPIGTVRYTYKLLNNNMDTIMILQKN